MPLQKVFANKERSVSKSGKAYKISIVIITLFFALPQKALPRTVQAKEPSLPPHLIQSVSGQDIYEGMLALGLSCCPVLREEDVQKAYENVRDSIVRVDMGDAWGSGVIFRLTDDGVIIATNRHVLEYWREDVGVIWFPQGFYVNARALGSAQNCDVGFLKVEGGELGIETLLTLRSVPVEEEIYPALSEGDAAFCLGADRTAGEIVYQEAVVGETRKYIDIFGGEMLYLHGFAREGMSGGGIFDGYGHLIGLLAGGTWQNEVAGVPVDQVQQAYREVVGE